jgi:radical SAM protein with 4Fe4S-binding SPASM domain
VAGKAKCEIQQVVVEVTRACNNDCLHCYNYWYPSRSPEKGETLLTQAEILRLIKKVQREAPLSAVALSGGEPFLRVDLPEIVCGLINAGLKVITITNGSLITPDRLRGMPRNSNFEVTLFSANQETHDFLAGRKAFNQVLAGLTLLAKEKHNFILACVLTKFNAQDITETIELGLAMGASGVMLNRINLSRHVLPKAGDLVPSAAALCDALGAADKAAAKYGISIALSVPVPPCIAEPKDFPHLHFGWCPRGGRDAYYTIGCTGLVRPCNHSSVILGDLRKQGFAEIVESAKARSFWAPIPPECIACTHPLKPFCCGGCPAAADECLGSRDRMDPFVTIASKPGIA